MFKCRPGATKPAEPAEPAEPRARSPGGRAHAPTLVVHLPDLHCGVHAAREEQVLPAREPRSIDDTNLTNFGNGSALVQFRCCCTLISEVSSSLRVFVFDQAFLVFSEFPFKRVREEGKRNCREFSAIIIFEEAGTPGVRTFSRSPWTENVDFQ